MTPWNVVDRAISYLFPGWGLRRLEARVLSDGFRATVEDAREFTRQNPGPRQEIEQNRQALLAAARQLDRQNDFAHGALNAIVDNVVGSTYRFEAKLKFADSGRPKSASNAAIEDAWWRWSESVDSTGGRSFGETLRLLERESWVTGEAFLLFTLDPRRRRGPSIVPLVVDLIEAERVDDQSDTMLTAQPGKPEIFDGIELDASGAVVAYHIHDRNPQDMASFSVPKRVPANRVEHYFFPNRPGQLRGLSRFGPVAASLKSLAEYLNFELTKAKTASALAILWKRGNRIGIQLPKSENDVKQDPYGNVLGQLYGGMIATGGPNDSLEAVNSGITSTAFDPFVRLVLRRVAAGLNISYELLARDFSAHNFSSIRQSFLEDRRHWEPRQQALTSVCYRVWKEFVRAGRLGDVTPIVSLRPDGEEQVEFHPPGFDWVDPLVERKADILGIKTGLQNVKQTAARHGYDLHQNLEDLADLRRRFEDAGLELPEELFQQEEMGSDEELESDEEEMLIPQKSRIYRAT